MSDTYRRYRAIKQGIMQFYQLRVKDQLGDDPLGELQQDRDPGDGAQDAQRDAARRDAGATAMSVMR